jgi:hypothetical protein
VCTYLSIHAKDGDIDGTDFGAYWDSKHCEE